MAGGDGGGAAAILCRLSGLAHRPRQQVLAAKGPARENLARGICAGGIARRSIRGCSPCVHALAATRARNLDLFVGKRLGAAVAVSNDEVRRPDPAHWELFRYADRRQE